MNVIETNNLTKKFGSVTALDGLNLSVKKGEIHGFLGPNGSGKSTTIRVLLGLMQKTEGKVALMEKDPWSASVELHKRLAYVPGDVNLWPNLTGGEIIDVLASLRGGIDERKREKLVKRFDLNPAKKFKTYSKGNKQKVALIAALSSEVDLLVMDEPTNGLDPLMEQVFQQEIKLLKEEGRTILLSSHILSEVEALCDRATIIKEGKTVSVFTLAELKKEHDNLESLFLSQYGEV